MVCVQVDERQRIFGQLQNWASTRIAQEEWFKFRLDLIVHFKSGQAFDSPWSAFKLGFMSSIKSEGELSFRIGPYIQAQSSHISQLWFADGMVL